MTLLESEFPIELAELVASELDTIQDLLFFSLVCRHFHSAVNCDQSVYRSLFLRLYEPPRKSDGYDYKTAFQHRHSRRFDEDVVRDIILDARPSRTQDVSQASIASSPNLNHLSKIFGNRSPPPALRSLLYPLQFLSPTSALFPQLHHTSPNQYRSITQTYPSETNKIADTFAQYLHPSSRHPTSLQQGLALLQPSEFPSFWEGDLISRETEVPTRWFGAFLYLPLEYNNRALGPSGPALMDITLNFSTPISFSSSGHDIAPYTMLQGKIQRDGDRLRVSWIKDYGMQRWIYEGMLEGGGQRVVGVWGAGINGVLNPRRMHGLFMLWAVPEDSASLESRR